MRFLSKIIFSILLICNLPSYASDNRLLEMVVTYPPGGAADIFGRNFQKYLFSNNVQSVVVNKPGADGRIGVNYVLSKNSDSNTAMIAATGPILFSKILYANLNYDYSQFNMVVPMARSPLIIAVSNQSGISTWQEFLDKGKTSKLNCGVSNAGSNFAAQYLIEQLGLKQVAVVSYKGTSDLIPGLISGNLDCAVEPYSAFVNLQKENKLKIIAVASRSKHTELPQAAVIRDTIDNFDFYFWYGIGVVKGHQVDERILTLANQAYLDSAFASSLKSVGFEMPKPPADSQKFLDSESVRFENMRIRLKIEKISN